MFTVKSKSEFLSDIRALHPNLINVRLNSVEVDRNKRSIRYNFICDKTVDDELKNLLLKEAEKITLPAFNVVTVTVKKIASDVELICNAIMNFLTSNYPSISVFLKTTDLSCSVGESQVRYKIKFTKDVIEYIQRNNVFHKLNEYLGKNFCSEFIGSYEEKEQEETFSLLNQEVYLSQLQKIEHRTIKVKDVCIIDDLHLGDLAIYLEDVTTYGTYVVCGKVIDVVERETKKGKPMFVFKINDTTGEIRGGYFTKKATYQKIRDIKAGDSIIARLTFGEYNGNDSYTFNQINRCTFPDNFEKKEKFKKSAPAQYSLIYPEPASTIKVSTVFDVEDELPKELTEKTYVIFDLETTGLDVMSNGITEIGAVKIVNGKISEQWTTLVKPDYNIDADNFKITGISNEMVKDSPKFSQVIPDFMKFIDGAVLVGHNASTFDIKFLNRFATAEDYEVKNELLDTLVMARGCLPELRKHDLATLAEHFGVVFHHHRALNDSYATAEVFIELMKIKHAKEKM